MKRKSKGRNERHGAAWGGVRLLLLALILVANQSFAQNVRAVLDNDGSSVNGKLAPDLARVLQGSSSRSMRVIVQYNQAPSANHFAKAQSVGAKLNLNLSLVNAGAFTMSPAAIRALAMDDNVAFISPDRKLKGMDDYTDSAIGVSTAWNSGYDGTGIGVAIIDSGINDGYHADFKDSAGRSRIVYHQDFTGTPTSNSSGATWDLYGHGTHVAGIVGGNGTWSAGRFAGVAPNVNLIDLRVLDQNGSGSDSMVIAAIQRAIALKNTYNIRVINLSLGRGVPTGYANDPLCQAVESAWRAGIVVVVASGNYGRLSLNGSNGYGTVTAPGNDPLVLTVGAMKTMNTSARTDDQIASYSSKGPTTYDHVVKPDLVAPGNTIVSIVDHGSTLEALYPSNLRTGTNLAYHPYFVLSGTSMATPVVSGAVALLLDQHASLTPDQVKARLMKTAYKTFPVSTVSTDLTTGQTFTSYYDIFTVGAGYLDVAAALGNNDLAPPAVGSAVSPSALYDSSTGTVSLVNGSSVVWGTSVVWGSSVVWGNSVVWGTNVSGSSVVWGTSVVWGSSVMSGFSVVWGTSTGSTSATSVVWGCSAFDGVDALSVAINGEQ
ncbi:MAG TPA: S8 family peptidase [Terriglobales bacterium]